MHRRNEYLGATAHFRIRLASLRSVRVHAVMRRYVGHGGCWQRAVGAGFGGRDTRSRRCRALPARSTSALDPHSEAVVVRGVHELTRDKTVIVVAHRLTTIAHADRSCSSTAVASWNAVRTPSCSRPTADMPSSGTSARGPPAGGWNRLRHSDYRRTGSWMPEFARRPQTRRPRPAHHAVGQGTPPESRRPHGASVAVCDCRRCRGWDRDARNAAPAGRSGCGVGQPCGTTSSRPGI